MSTLITHEGRAKADQAHAAVLAGAGDRVDHYLDLEDEEQAHAGLSELDVLGLDAELASAEARPGVTAGQAATAQARETAATLAWFQAGHEAETEAEAG